ncbi:pyridoxamine 5'-phosphate oxidase family protein [Nocardia thailandica]|uniref:Pyridoxamine 5'-phosphate oxidase family protein n=1 Tax=Nocardia thailandica TaxID=257275 RepID=A0ABW6PLT0_9NOCA
MTGHYAQVAFTPLVRAHQEAHGSARSYERMARVPEAPDTLGAAEIDFLAGRDSFFLATVGETGWPYIQHRGGPAGFLRVLGPRTLGFADFRGNKQYISRGNLDHDDRVSLFVVDYPTRTRLKIFGRARVVEPEADAELVAALTMPGYPARVERAVLIEVEAFDWNCHQHIPELYPREAVAAALDSLRERIGDLERENARLREALPPA